VRTGFTEADLSLLFTSLVRLFEGGPRFSRGEMAVRGLYDFEHIGTQSRRNTEQNRREARLGCAPSQDLFGGIEIRLQPGREMPLSFADYQVTCQWEREPLPAGVQLHKRHEALLEA
jgi:CRISPR-associated protein Csd2